VIPWEEEEVGLFEEPMRRELRPGDEVKLRTIWGEEMCRVEQVGRDTEGWPIVTVFTASGDRVTVSRSSIIPPDVGGEP
jgi:hypothetical protein